MGNTQRWLIATGVILFAVADWGMSPEQNCAADDASLRPNVLIILADDQGWGDLSAHGNVNLATPNIDSLARDGATLDNFYVCQVCAPTRAEFLTGRYYPRTGVSGVSTGRERLNPDETTVADLFRSSGYATGAFGKWHNGTQPPYHPTNRGFGEFYGFTSGHWSHYFSPPLDHNNRRVRGNGFIVDDVTDHAISFVEANAEGPFFCYVPLNTPHSPMMVPDRFYEKFEDADVAMRREADGEEDVVMTRAALALCENIDWNVGRLLETLDALDLRERTIVVYFSDNGPNSYRWNGRMKGRKGRIDEGGLRSPFFIRWPQKIDSGMRVEEIAGAIDLLPTLSDLAGVKVRVEKPLDGRSLRPLLLQEKVDWPSRSLFAVKNQDVSVRTQQFRLDAEGRLFDIQSDRGQQNDVSDRYPTLAADLARRAEQHGEAMQRYFEVFSDRPFTVGFGPTTTLPARDGVGHGEIQRSSKAPNNSFFKNWTREEDTITWDIDVGESGAYDAVVYYTCAAGNEGVVLELGIDGGDSAAGMVRHAFDPPLYDKSKERMPESHYRMKDFKPLSLGQLNLEQGRAVLRLSARGKRGSGIADIHSIDLVRQ